MPVVSVITPTYNRASYIGEAIETVLNQTYRDWELIVVDDGSTDHTKGVVESYAKKDSRICYVWQENARAAAARNTALARARGKYVAFLDDDDRWLPEKLEIQVDFMERHPEIGLGYTCFQVFRSVNDYLEKGKLFPQVLITEFEQLSDAFIPPSAVMMKKSCLDKLGGFSEKYGLSEDFDLYLRFVQRWKMAPINKVLATTVIDDRPHAAQNEIRVNLVTSEILRNLELVGKYKNRKGLITQWIALRFYFSGRLHLDERNYVQAAKYFAKALLTDPLVGLVVKQSGEEGFVALLKRIAVTYLAVPACLVKGLIHARR